MFGDVLAHIPRSMSCQHLWVHSPALCRAPCPASPNRLRRSVLRHSLGAGCGVVGGWSRSLTWGWSMVWVTRVFDVVGVTAGRGSWSSCCLLVDDFGVDGVFHKSVRGCGRACWSRTGSSCWPSSLLMACASLVFEVVGVVAGRGVGCRVACLWPWLVSMGLAFRVFEVVVMFDGRGLGRCAGRRCGRWCVPQACSMTWA